MADSKISANDFTQGVCVKSGEKNFGDAVKAAVDYRGDISVYLADGNSVEGYIFSTSQEQIDLFPRNSPRAISIPLADIERIEFSGEDPADGKTYDDWISKKEAEKAAIKSQPIELS